MSAFRAITSAVATAIALIATPAYAQHQGHDMHAMPAPPKPATKRVAPKPVAKPAPKAAAKRVAKPAPRAVAKPAAKAPSAKAGMDHSAMDHAAMGHAMPAAAKPARKAAAPARKPASKPARKPAPRSPSAATRRAPAPAAASKAVDHSRMHHPETHAPPAATPVPAPKPGQAVDHSTMDHSQMDHSTMGHAMPATPDVDHGGMDHANMPGMRHGAHGAGGTPSPDLPADAPPRTPIPALTDADRASAFPPGAHGHETHDRRINSYWLVDRLEVGDRDGSGGWEGLAWVGGDLHRAWLRTEGEFEDGRVDHGNAELLYGRSVTTWWDVVAGVRHDFGDGPSRTYAAIGVQGLAPYKFEVEATAYIGSAGRTALTLEAEYDTLITNRLILQWQAEANLHGRSDVERGIGSGLSTVEAGARLRYEFTRRFAPYVGVQAERAFGETADLRRDDGHERTDTRLVAGFRFWF